VDFRRSNYKLRACIINANCTYFPVHEWTFSGSRRRHVVPFDNSSRNAELVENPDTKMYAGIPNETRIFYSRPSVTHKYGRTRVRKLGWPFRLLQNKRTITCSATRLRTCATYLFFILRWVSGGGGGCVGGGETSFIRANTLLKTFANVRILRTVNRCGNRPRDRYWPPNSCVHNRRWAPLRDQQVL